MASGAPVTMAKRAVYRVRWVKARTWQVRWPGGMLDTAPITSLPAVWGFRYKAQAVSAARAAAQRNWRERGLPSQLVVHTKRGRISFEHTYGRSAPAPD